MKRVGLFALLSLAAGLRAQTGCGGALQFQNVVQQPAWVNGTVGSGLLRQADGSFTQLTYDLKYLNSTPAHTGTAANFQQSYLNCAALPARTRNPGLPKLGTDQLGTASRNPVAVDLAGNGIPAVLGIWQPLTGNTLLVGQPNADFSGKNVTRYPVGLSASTILTGDFNGDGKHDAAVIYAGPDNASTPGGVSLLIGNGDGTLKSAVNYPVGKFATSGVAWDFNGDGRTDLAVLAYDNSNNPLVVILTGNSDGTLTTGATYRFASSVPTVGTIAVADLNGDGIADLLVSTYGGLSVLYGVAGGTFKAATSITTLTNLAFVATGDFNKDGKVDIAFADLRSTTGDVFIMINQGNGVFAPPVGYYIAYEPHAFFVEDFDGDGNLDLVFSAGHPDLVTSETGYLNVGVLFGNGDGTFAGEIAYPVAHGNGPALATADFNGDGLADIATASLLLLGKGKGVFAAPTALPLNSVAPNSMAAGDVNGDGKPDLVLTDLSGAIYVMLNIGNGNFATPVRTSSTAGAAGVIVLGDFNNDKKLDIVVTIPGNVAFLAGNGDGTFKAAVNITVATNPVALVAADLNGDGKLDLVVACQGAGLFSTDHGGVTILRGNGDGTFQATTYATGITGISVSVGDVNGDGKLDLIVSTANTDLSPALAELLGNGNGTFQPAVLMPTEFGPTQTAIADFNGDGKADLVTLHCCGNTDFTYRLGVGDGTFQPEVTLRTGEGSSVVMGDWNGDGKPDMAVINGSRGYLTSVSILLNVTPAPATNTPAITAGGVLSAASFGGFPVVGPGTWMEIYGANLAPNTRPWLGPDFNGANAPTSLDGVKVTIGGQSAFVDYISPGQIDAQVPSNVAAGLAQLTVTTPTGTSANYPITVNALQPGLLAPPSFMVGGKQYVVAQFADGSYVLPPGSISGLTTRQAKPGETIIIYGIGFGPVTPNILAGQVVGQANQLASSFQMLFGGTAATFGYFGLAPNFVGLYQFNVVVPAVTDNDAVQLSFKLGGAPGTQTLYTAVHQ